MVTPVFWSYIVSIYVEKISLNIKTKFDKWELLAICLAAAHYFFLVRLAPLATADYSELFTASVDQPTIVRMFFDAISGSAPAYTPYGMALIPLLWLFLLPIVTLLSIFGITLPFSIYVVILRCSQMALASSSIYLIYRVTRRYSNGFFGIMAMLLIFNSYALAYWSLILKPDIWMLFFLIMAAIAATEACCRASDGLIVSGRNYFAVSAFLWGLAIGSKAWAVFFGPCIFIAAFVLRFYSRISWKNGLSVLRFFLLPILVFGVAIAVSIPHFFIHHEQISGIFKWVDQNYNTLPYLEAFWRLFPQKVQLLTSWQFGGPFLFSGFLFGFFYFLPGIWKSRADLGSIFKKFPFILLAYLCTYLGFLFFVYRDTFNILGIDAERNVISIVVPFAVILAVALFQSWQSKRKLVRACSVVISAIIIMLVASNWLWGFNVEWQPYPRVIHHDRFKQVINRLSAEDAVSYSRFYDNTEDFRQHRLKMPETPEALAKLHSINKYLSFEIPPQIMFNTQFSIWNLASQFRKEFQSPQFTVRKWVQEHVHPNSLLLAEYYINLLKNECFTPIDDLPPGTRIIQPADIFVKVEDIEKMNPDYVFTKYRNIADEIATKHSEYKLIERLEGSVFILAREPK